MALLHAVTGGNGNQGGSEQELRAVGDASSSFQQWFQSTTSSLSGGSPSIFFEQLLRELQDQGISDYHLRLSNCFNHQRRQPLPGWEVCIKHGGDAERAGPVTVTRCMSCHLDARLIEGVLGTEAAAAFDAVDAISGGKHTCEAAAASVAAPFAVAVGDDVPRHSPGGPTSQDSLVMETGRMRVWFDAKARPMLVITPKRVSTLRRCMCA